VCALRPRFSSFSSGSGTPRVNAKSNKPEPVSLHLFRHRTKL
jgi:hypothetical protein